jgi:hypothetical protein
VLALCVLSLCICWLGYSKQEERAGSYSILLFEAAFFA